MARAIDAEKTKACIQNVVEHLAEAGNKAMAVALSFAIEIIDEQPTIEPKQEWISVKDRLPEEKVKVLVVLGSNIRGKRICIDQRIPGKWRGLGCLVTHWMPMPEPPERDDE